VLPGAGMPAGGGTLLLPSGQSALMRGV
jgi:hypothetical protein